MYFSLGTPFESYSVWQNINSFVWTLLAQIKVWACVRMGTTSSPTLDPHQTLKSKHLKRALDCYTSASRCYDVNISRGLKVKFFETGI